ncbi:abortive phage infection protein [[Phormidium ambiguum] IAM M-71]|uniref:Abortive phage infection protein n=1 Tax=[Phormidium ambiguum] IAM M-71 TaxID=454136 RepID=A0A1U7ISF3_9CYAN|nr:type II CAAX endopeptidase family protein [Phormidium ambiguum]OKH40376.1 abortive phage infection protein [Phormidium ambiguum IAM M-71]
MTFKRLILGLLTVFLVVFFIGPSLLGSWQQPQIQSRLELYQTNLLLHATEWQGEPGEEINSKSLRDTLIGVEPLKNAQKQYQEAREQAETNLAKTKAQAQVLPTKSPQLESTVTQLQDFINQADLRLGILQATQGETTDAIATWKSVIKNLSLDNSDAKSLQVAEVLIGLWSNPNQILPDSEAIIKKSFAGWFRYQSLSQLYSVQQREEALAELKENEQEIAEKAVLKLAIVGAVPTIGFLIGVGLVLFLLIQRAIKGKDSLLAQNGDLNWSTPWDGEIILQVFVAGFFLMQILVSILVLPISLKLLNLDTTNFDLRSKALLVFVNYLFVAAAALLVLYVSIKTFFPLPEGWFQFKLLDKWVFWGFGGYVAALPLVIVVSLINQQVWQGQGGSNPLLSLALEGKDLVALGIFFVTAAIAAPIFEEILFRGFLLPSLTRYLPVWGAIVVSSLLFAIAHLSLSEVLPLTTLGIVLGVVYTRSRNLLASIFLHSLWNSGTLISLFLLGSSV